MKSLFTFRHNWMAVEIDRRNLRKLKILISVFERGLQRACKIRKIPIRTLDDCGWDGFLIKLGSVYGEVAFEFTDSRISIEYVDCLDVDKLTELLKFGFERATMINVAIVKYVNFEGNLLAEEHVKINNQIWGGTLQRHLVKVVRGVLTVRTDDYVLYQTIIFEDASESWGYIMRGTKEECNKHRKNPPKVMYEGLKKIMRIKVKLILYSDWHKVFTAKPVDTHGPTNLDY